MPALLHEPGPEPLRRSGLVVSGRREVKKRVNITAYRRRAIVRDLAGRDRQPAGRRAGDGDK
jgi:hypothetical protein